MGGDDHRDGRREGDGNERRRGGDDRWIDWRRVYWRWLAPCVDMRAHAWSACTRGGGKQYKQKSKSQTTTSPQEPK